MLEFFFRLNVLYYCLLTDHPQSHTYNWKSYLVVAVHGSSNQPAALSRCCRDVVAKGEGLVAMVAGRVLERSLRGGVELQGTLGKKSWSYMDRVRGGWMGERRVMSLVCECL